MVPLTPGPPVGLLKLQLDFEVLRESFRRDYVRSVVRRLAGQ